MIKRRLRATLRRLGLHVYTDGSLPTGVSWLHDLRRHGRVRGAFFDVGANVGQTVEEIRGEFPHAAIHAFEPVASTYAELAKRTGSLPGVVCHHLALGARPGSTEIRLANSSVLNSLVATPATDQDGACETITIATVDDICREARIDHIDALKTDTEGYDLEVLRGASGMLDSGSIDFVLSEVTPLAHNGRNTPLRDVGEFLEARGFMLLGLYETYSLHHFAEPNVYCNALLGRRACLPGWPGRAI